MLDYEERKTIDRDQFRLVHYAGTVTYTITGTSIILGYTLTPCLPVCELLLI